MRVKVSKITSLTYGEVPVTTSFSFGRTSYTRFVYVGTLAVNKWISVVNAALNTDFPCEDGAVAAGTASTTHSGSSQADGTKALVINTTVLDVALTYAVCYTEALGTANASWVDSGIRFTASDITGVQYGTASSSFPIRTMLPTNVAQGTHRLPQVANTAILTYVGDLANDKYMSVVDASLNMYHPCETSVTAAATEDSTHSGAVQATGATKVVTIAQNTLLDESKIYAICYSIDNSAWLDSNVRVEISKVSTISSHAVNHVTDGEIARASLVKPARYCDSGTWSKYVTSTVCTLGLQLTYSGTLMNNKWLTLVDQMLNPTPAGSFPCASGAVAAATSDTAHSGSLQAGASDGVVLLDTDLLSSAITFAVCYAESLGTTGATWYDSGVRLDIAKITTIKYGSYSSTYPIRAMTSVNLAAATNRLPQVVNTVITYTGGLMNTKWLSVVDSSLHGNNPCVSAPVAAAAEDGQHSGPLQALSLIHI